MILQIRQKSSGCIPSSGQLQFIDPQCYVHSTVFLLSVQWLFMYMYMLEMKIKFTLK